MDTSNQTQKFSMVFKSIKLLSLIFTLEMNFKNKKYHIKIKKETFNFTFSL